MKALTLRGKGAVSHARLKKRLGGLILSGIAVLFTILPLFSFSLWIKNIYFSDPRDTLALTQIEAPALAPDLFNEPIVSVTFDDGWESVYSQAAPILDKYGIRTTQYILSGQFEHYSYLSEEQVLSLQAAGHDIQSHTISHADLRQTDDQTLRTELAESQQEISSLTKTPVADFASPLNSYDNRTLKSIKQYYRSHRNTEALVNQPGMKDYNLKQNFNIYQIKAFSVRRTTTTEEIQNFLAKAREMNAWAVLVYHEVDSESSSHYAVTPQQFKAQMQTTVESNLRLATMDEVLDVYENSQK